MANGYQRVTALGNLGADPELRHTQSGIAVMNFRMGCSESVKQDNGEWSERTEWIPIVVWGRRAEGLFKVLRKGEKVFVEGRLRTTKYTDKHGQERWKTEVHAREVVLSGGRRDGNAAANGNGGYRGGAPQPPAAYGPEDDDDDDLPF